MGTTAKKSGRFYIGLYGGGAFQGYLKTISNTKQRVWSTHDLEEAKSYATEKTAKKNAELVEQITYGGLVTDILIK